MNERHFRNDHAKLRWLTWAPIRPWTSRYRSVWDQGDECHGSSPLKFLERSAFSNLLWIKLRIFHAKSLCLQEDETHSMKFIGIRQAFRICIYKKSISKDQLTRRLKELWLRHGRERRLGPPWKWPCFSLPKGVPRQEPQIPTRGVGPRSRTSASRCRQSTLSRGTDGFWILNFIIPSWWDSQIRCLCTSKTR